MNSRRFKSSLDHLSVAEIRGIAQLVAEATGGVTDIVEGVHQSVASTVGFSDSPVPGRTRGVTGLVYRSIRGITTFVGIVVDSVLAWFQPSSESTATMGIASSGREAVLAALNGVMGDRLAASNNPLAASMTLRCRGNALERGETPDLREATTGKVLLMIHGLCMNDLQWNAQHDGQPVNHANILGSELGYTPVYLRYNSGLHISENARQLSVQLERLLDNWPVVVEELTVVAHSMGGLLIRSAFHYASHDALRWPGQLKNIVFLGAPHHGAPLERAGNLLDVILGKTRFSAPFASLGQLRSAGITDLRYGNLLEEDWRNTGRFVRQPDGRQPIPLPNRVSCYTIAATRAHKRSELADRLTGDGLVPLNSALGDHADPKRILLFAEEAQMIAYQTNHMALLSSPDVTWQMVKWLGSEEGKDAHRG